MSQTADSHGDTAVLPGELRGEHRVRQGRFMIMFPRLMIVLAVVLAVLFARGEMWPPAVLWGAGLPVLVVAEVLRRRERVDLGASGVAIHRGFRPRRISWDEVRSITPPDRWSGEALIHATGGRVATLRGVDAETARGLVRWFEQARLAANDRRPSTDRGQASHRSRPR